MATGDEAEKRKRKWRLAMKWTRKDKIGNEADKKEVATGDEADKRKGKWILAMTRTKRKSSNW